MPRHLTPPHVHDIGETTPPEALTDPRRPLTQPPVQLSVERPPQPRLSIENRPEPPPIPVRIRRSTGGNRHEEIDEGEFGTPTSTVDVEQGPHPLQDVLAHLGTQTRGPVAAGPRTTFEDADRHEVIKHASQRQHRRPHHALRQFVREELTVATPTEDTPGRTDYSLTTTGETEFHRLLRDALRRPEHRPDTLGTALALLPAHTREDAITLLTETLRTLETEHTEKAKLAELGTQHLRELPLLWEHTARGGMEWTRGLLHRLRSGAYAMTNDDTNTTPS